MIYDATELGSKHLNYKVLDENGDEIKYVKACDPEEGWYIQYNRLKNDRFELEKTERPDENGVYFQAKLYKKTNKFKLIDTETGLEVLK